MKPASFSTLAPANGRRLSGDGDRVSPHGQHDAEALTFATSLFPDRHKEDPFFTEPGASLHCVNCDRESWIARLDPSLSSNSGKLFTATRSSATEH